MQKRSLTVEMPMKSVPAKEVSISADASGLVSRNIKLATHRTSVRLEPEMWIALHEVAAEQKMTIHELCESINLAKRGSASFSSAIRVFLLQNYRLKGADRDEWIARPCDPKRFRELQNHYAKMRQAEAANE